MTPASGVPLLSDTPTEAVTETSQPVERLKACRVAVPTPHVVAGYLSRFPGLEGAVAEVASSVRSEFQGECSLALGVSRDPESGEECLTLYVRLPRYDVGTMDRIHAASGKHHELLDRAGGVFLAWTDYQPMR